MNTATVLINWYNKNKRDLPWRTTHDPYLIWVSEIIMQQTRINQGLPYYIKFIKQFPTVKHLAESSVDSVYLAWQGLGYYSRARNMHATAQQIVTDFGGQFPNTAAGLLKLKGIGSYTSAAIASICYGEQIPAIDGNVLRVISRLYNIDEPINTAKGRKTIEALSLKLIENCDAGTYNQAVMDFGATICTPAQPKCKECTIAPNCLSLDRNTVASRPVKNNKTLQRTRYFIYICFRCNSNTIIVQRKGKDIWEGLFELPLWEFDSPIEPKNFLQLTNIVTLLNGITITNVDIHIPDMHKLSHQLIQSTFIEITTNQLPKIQNSKTVPFNKLDDFAFPKLIEKYLASKLKKVKK